MLLLDWINNGLLLLLGIALLFNKKRSNLRLVKLYAFGYPAFSFTFKFFFYNDWDFYLVTCMGQAILFVLVYWEIALKQEQRNLHILLVAASAVLLAPLLPISMVAKSIFTFSIVDAAIVLTLPFAFKSRNPILIIWGVISAYAFLILDVLELLLPTYHQAYLILSTFSTWTAFLPNIGIVAVILWEPVTTWLYQRLQRIPSLNKSRLSLVSGGSDASISSAEVHNIEDFTPPRTDTEFQRMNLERKTKELESIFKNTARIFTLKHKPFLTPEEAMDYLGMDEDELEDFLVKYKIRKMYLSGKTDTWVVRRAEVDSAG